MPGTSGRFAAYRRGTRLLRLRREQRRYSGGTSAVRRHTQAVQGGGNSGGTRAEQREYAVLERWWNVSAAAGRGCAVGTALQPVSVRDQGQEGQELINGRRWPPRRQARRQARHAQQAHRPPAPRAPRLSTATLHAKVTTRHRQQGSTSASHTNGAGQRIGHRARPHRNWRPHDFAPLHCHEQPRQAWQQGSRKDHILHTT